jgi:tyrosine aminotransferase
VGGNLPPCPQAIQGIITSVQQSPHVAGYVHACGTVDAREAIARYHSYPLLQQQQLLLHADNVIVANGCSGALEIALTALLDPDTILLVPKPGFPLYQVIAESHGASVAFYRLDPDRRWEIDMDYLEHLVAQYPPGKIRGIVINNPSNPTGAVFSETHLHQIVDFCLKFKLPIIADEVYGDLVLGDHEFHPVAHVAAQAGRKVPIITASGLAKQFLLPGWRVGWICFQDKYVTMPCRHEPGPFPLLVPASHTCPPIRRCPTVTKVLLQRCKQEQDASLK